MAVNSSTYSGKQFEVYIAPDKVHANGVGTIFAGSTWTGANRLDVEGITLPSFSPTQEFEMRSGSSRIAEFDQIFSSSKRVITEFTLSGRLTQEAWAIFLENVLSTEITGGADNSVVTIGSSYAPANFAHDDTIATATTYSKTLSVYFQAPTVTDSYGLTGCVCTSLNVDGDMDSSSGRMNYSATFQTMYAPAKGTIDVAGATAIGSNFIFLPDLDNKNIDIKITGSHTDDIDPLFKTFNLSIESPTQFLGAQGDDAEPQVFARAIPELTINYGGSIKYDELTDEMVEAFRDPQGDSYITMYMSDIPHVGTTETPTGNFFGTPSVSKFGFCCRKAKLTSAEVSSDDVAMLSFEAKVLAPSSGDTAYFLAGDNAA